MGKFEREAKRRERKEQQRDVERGFEKHKERKIKENKMKTWRKDQHGNIIFKGALKFSKTALVGLIVFTAIVIFFAVAIITNEEDADKAGIGDLFRKVKDELKKKGTGRWDR